MKLSVCRYIEPLVESQKAIHEKCIKFVKGELTQWQNTD